MTELFIDGNRVVLPSGIGMTIKDQNPIITKNGTFTLDITLSLLEFNNSKIYRHMERLQNSSAIKGRKALLLSDGKVILNGTEAILGCTENEVRIQILSGNSELNYFIVDDIYISELDLGKETDMGNARLNENLKKVFPETAFTSPMVKIGKNIYNRHPENFFEVTTEKPFTFSNIAIQPFLLAMIEKIIRALGYDIAHNQAKDDDFMRRVFILNDDKSGEYNKVLPGWKVKEFLEECERMLNIIFIIDKKSKKVEVLQAAATSDTGTYAIDNVLDAFERTVVEDNPAISYKNVSYDFPSSNEYKHQDIEDDILGMATITRFKTFYELTSFLKVPDNIIVAQYIPEEEALKYYNSLNLFYVSDYDTYYLVDQFTYKFPGSPTNASASWYYLRKMNTFRKYASSKDSEFLFIKFIPALRFFLENGEMYANTLGIPYLPGVEEGKDKEESSIKKIIENGVKDFNSLKKKVALSSFYPSGSAYFTLTDNVAENDTCISWYEKKYGTFRLNGPEGMAQRYYQANSRYDMTNEYTIKFLINTMPDVRAKFLLNGKLFICKEIEYQINKEGIHPVVTGVFYPVIK